MAIKKFKINKNQNKNQIYIIIVALMGYYLFLINFL